MSKSAIQKQCALRLLLQKVHAELLVTVQVIFTRHDRPPFCANNGDLLRINLDILIPYAVANFGGSIPHFAISWAIMETIVDILYHCSQQYLGNRKRSEEKGKMKS